MTETTTAVLDPFGDPFLINTTTNQIQDEPAVAALDNGSYIVAWQTEYYQAGTDGGFHGIAAQLFDADNTPIGEELTVYTDATGFLRSPSVTALANGGFLIAFARTDGRFETSYGSYGRIYNADGEPQGDEIELDAFLHPTQNGVQKPGMSDPSVFGMSDGGFIVVGRADPYGTTDRDGVYGQRFDAAGVAIGERFKVTEVDWQSDPRPQVVELAGGGFVVAFEGGEYPAGISYQVYAVDGTAVGEQQKAYATTNNIIKDGFPELAALPDGGFAMVWRWQFDRSLSVLDNDQIFLRVFDASGTPRGEAERIDTVSPGTYVSHPVVSVLETGEILTVWKEWTYNFDDMEGDGLWGRRYEADGTPIDEAPFSITTHGVGSTVRDNLALTTLANGDTAIFWSEYVAWYEGTPLHGNEIYGQILFANAAPTGSLELQGSGEEGSVLVVQTTVFDADGIDSGSVTYSWMRDGEVFQSGTKTSYTVQATDAGYEISVLYEFTDGRGTLETVTSNSITATGLNNRPEGQLLLTGTTRLGTTLTADASGLSDPDGIGSLSYQWYRDGLAIEGATTGAYTLTSSDLDRSIHVAVSYLDGMGTQEQVASDPLLITNENAAPTGEVLITGTARVGETLSVDTSALFDPDELGAFTYQWLRDGVAILGANGTTYTVVEADGAARISVQLTYIDGFGTEETVFSQASGRVATDAPAKVGEEIQVSPLVTEPVYSNTNGYDPQIVALEDGTFAVIWFQQIGTIGDKTLVAQKFDADGTELSAKVTIAELGYSLPEVEAVTLSNGDIALMWFHRDDGSDDTTLRGQILNADLGLEGGYFDILTTATTDPEMVSLLAMDTGGFLATWVRSDGPYDWYSYVMAQAFDASGAKIGDEQQISAQTMTAPAYGTAPNPEPKHLQTATGEGGTLLAYVQRDLEEGSTSRFGDFVFVQSFDASGQATGALKKLDAGVLTLPSQLVELAALADGTFLLVEKISSGYLDEQYRAVVLSADGIPTGKSFDFQFPGEGTTRANQYSWTADLQILPLADGGFLGFHVYYNPDRNDDNKAYTDAVYTQRFDNDGQPIGGLVQVNTYDVNDQNNADAVLLSDGTVAVTWASRFVPGSALDPEGIPGDIRAQLLLAYAEAYEPPAPTGTPEADTLIGTDGTDVIDGFEGNDSIDAKGGDDTANGNEGNDTVHGGAGNDMVSGADGDDFLFLGTGNDSAGGGAGNDDITVEAGSVGETNHIWAGPGNDTVRGNASTEIVDGGDGADLLIGGDGNDTLIGGTSVNDLRDVIYAGDGDDSAQGGYGNDELRGDAGNDTLEGGYGADTVIGGAGDDVLTAGAWGDVLMGGDGADFINGGFGFDRVNGGSGADKFFHQGVLGHGDDWIQDYVAADGDVLMFGGGAASKADFLVQRATTTGAGAATVQELFITYKPTGDILWALIDGDAQAQINVLAGGQTFDIL